MVLPERRVIESMTNLESVPCDYADEIMAAIYAGQQLNCFSLARAPHPTTPPEPAKETCLTRFTDPREPEERWAVEVWSYSRKWTRDFATEGQAQTYQSKERDRLGI